MNLYNLGTIHSRWYLIAPLISFISYTLNITKCIYYVLSLPKGDKELDSKKRDQVSPKSHSCRKVMLAILILMFILVIFALIVFFCFIWFTTTKERMDVPAEFNKDFGLQMFMTTAELV
jgi:hypothetical protein